MQWHQDAVGAHNMQGTCLQVLQPELLYNLYVVLYHLSHTMKGVCLHHA